MTDEHVRSNAEPNRKDSTESLKADSIENSKADSSESDTPPDAVIEEAERLTHLAREALDEAEAAAYREAREELLAGHDYTARVREEDRDILVLHPEEWVEDGTVYPDRIDDIERGIERALDGVGLFDDWEAVAQHNDELAARVEDEHGAVHGANANALAAFMNNHYAKPIEDASGAELREFLTEFFPRNTWPSDEQKAVVEESIRLVFESAGERLPDF